LTGDVTKVSITATGSNTTYVTKISFYDAKGNVVTVNRADKIKKLLSPYVDSANFVVTKSGTPVNRTNYTMLGFGGVNNEKTAGVDVLGNPYKYNVIGRGIFSVLTASGLKQFSDGISEKIMTATGIKDLNMSYALDSQYYPTITGVNGDQIPDIKNIKTILESETIQTEYASNSFTFISRGWGHGVGLSQYGIYELGNVGYDYKYILEAYYSGIVMKRMGSVIKGSDNRYYINFGDI
jgi:SpoIID/LytB domain protein